MNLYFAWLVLVVDWRISNAQALLNFRADVIFLIIILDDWSQIKPEDRIMKWCADNVLRPFVDDSQIDESKWNIAIIISTDVVVVHQNLTADKEEAKKSVGNLLIYSKPWTDFGKALTTAGEIFESGQRPNASKILVLNVLSGNSSVQQQHVLEMGKGARPLRKAGVMIYGITTDGRTPESVDLIHRVTPHWIFRASKNQNSAKEIIKLIHREECTKYTEVCGFKNRFLTVCAGDTFWPTGVTGCNLTATTTTSSSVVQCTLRDCYEECDRAWPWMSSSGVCNILLRDGPLPYPYLTNCPKNKTCDSESAGVSASGIGVPYWAVGVAGVGSALVAVAIILIYVRRRAKRIENIDLSLSVQQRSEVSSRSCRAKKTGNKKSKKKPQKSTKDDDSTSSASSGRRH